MEIVVDTQDAPALDEQLASLRGQLEQDPDFAAESAVIEEGGDLTIVSVALNTEGSSEEASAAIDRLRDDYVPEAFADASDRVLVGGLPAENRDFFALIGNWLPIVIAFVLALTLVLLTLAFRSIVIALTAIAVNLLSVAAAYGLLVLVFQEGVGDGPVRIRSGRPDRGVGAGLSVLGAVRSLDGLPGVPAEPDPRALYRHRRYDRGDHLWRRIDGAADHRSGADHHRRLRRLCRGELVSFQQMGFGVAIALLIDATIVRLVVIPAAMQLLGERNWYLPSWLEWLPHVEIEDPALTPGQAEPRASRDPGSVTT